MGHEGTKGQATDVMVERFSRVKAAEAVASRWSELGIPFVIAHGLEDYPLALGRDLDILMHPRHAQRALHEARQTLAMGDWPTAVCPPSLWGDRLVALGSNGNNRYEYLEFHTMGEFSWLALRLVAADVSVTSWTGPFPTNAWTTFAKAVMLPLLGGDTARFTSTYLESMWRPIKDADEIEAQMNHLIGSRLAAELLAASKAHDGARLLGMQSDVRRRCLLHMATHPASTVTRLWPFLRKRFGRAFSNSGTRVRLSTPSGVDARDIASRIVEELRHVFVVIRVDRPRRWSARLGQQFHVLSRQGLILEVATNRSQEYLTLSATGRAGRLQPTVFFPISENAERLAAWILKQWADSMSCP